MRRKNLLTQVLVVNLLLMVAAVVAAGVAGNPTFDLGERPELALVLGLAVALTILANVFMLQRRFRPLERLVDEMERADLSRPRANLEAASDGRSDPEEVARLQLAFRRMLDRLEAERRSISSAALAAQEEERARVARDLHDEVNQSLTALLLRLEAARVKAPVELAHELADTKALANQAMEELLMLARQLRPTALDDLGLKAALAGHVEELGRRAGIKASLEAQGDFSDLPADVQLVVYRVAQESLSNAVRHSGAETVRVRRAPRAIPLWRGGLGRADRRRRRVRVHVRPGGSRAGDHRDARAGPAGRGRRRGGVATERRDACQPQGAVAAGRYRGEAMAMGEPGNGDAAMKVLIADDHGIVRSGLRMLLERQMDIEVIGEAADGAQARDMAIRERPDLAILDVKMPKLTGLQATREIRAQAPDVAVLILSMYDDERYLFEALKAGASGYVLKAQADSDLLEAVRAVERGEPFLTPEAQRALIQDVLGESSSREEELTPREQEVVKLVAEAHTNKEIAEILHLSEKTVENHRSNAMRKLGMRDRVELVRYAIRKGLIEP